MLNRRDLAKQFELIVQQEIKNYQNSLNTVLQSIRDLKEEIASVKRDCAESKAALHSEILAIKSALSSHASFMSLLDKSHTAFRNDQLDINNSTLLSLQENKLNNSDLRNDNVKNFGLFVAITDRIDKLSATNKENLNSIMSAMDNLERKIYKESDKTKAEIVALPTDTQAIKKELEEKINIHNIDAAGIIREIRLLSRAVMVTEKKIENIYTMIGRMKKAEVIP